MIRPIYRNEFEKDGLEKVRDNVLRNPYKDAEQQEQAKAVPWVRIPPSPPEILIFQ
jgi:hypothetical protein